MHTIDPKTGYPVKSNLLSATILTNDCMSADAFATSCMVMGFDKSVRLIESSQSIQGYLIYVNEKGKISEWYSQEFENYMR